MAPLASSSSSRWTWICGLLEDPRTHRAVSVDRCAGDSLAAEGLRDEVEAPAHHRGSSSCDPCISSAARAVHGVSLRLNPAKVFTIIGPTGAGKTTIFNLIGLIYPAGQPAPLRGPEAEWLGLHRVAEFGIATRFKTFSRSTRHGAAEPADRSPPPSPQRSWQELLFTPGVCVLCNGAARGGGRRAHPFDLAHYRDSLVAGLPYGVRKVIELARALATEPRLLLLDEPFLGLNPEETDDMAFWIEDIKNDLGITVPMVFEHDISLVARVSDRAPALNQGERVADRAGHAGRGGGAPGGDRG